MKGPKMKPWTTQFVTCLWGSGGFDGIAQLHNRELEQLKRQMNNNSKQAEDDNSENIFADRPALRGGLGVHQ